MLCSQNEVFYCPMALILVALLRLYLLSCYAVFLFTLLHCNFDTSLGLQPCCWMTTCYIIHLLQDNSKFCVALCWYWLHGYAKITSHVAVPCIGLRYYAVSCTLLCCDLVGKTLCLVLSTYSNKIIISVLHPVDTGCVTTPKLLVALLCCASVRVATLSCDLVDELLWCATLSTYANKIFISVLHPVDNGFVATPNLLVALLCRASVRVATLFLWHFSLVMTSLLTGCVLNDQSMLRKYWLLCYSLLALVVLLRQRFLSCCYAVCWFASLRCFFDTSLWLGPCGWLAVCCIIHLL